MKVISYGTQYTKNRGRKTAQVVIASNGKSTTKHLVQWGEVFTDSDGKAYDLKIRA